MRIRPAAFNDLPAILEISNNYALTTPVNFALEFESLESWQEDWRQTHERHPWFVADAEGIVGFAKSSPWKGRCAYHWTAEVTVYVRPENHGRGIGRALYTRLIDTLRRQGYRTLLGGITQPNEASVRLHESLGFKRVAVLERVGFKFDRWHDVGYWELILGEGNVPPQDIKPVCEVLDQP